MKDDKSTNVELTTSDGICPDCGGTGIVIDYVAGCCRNPNEDGSCCNCPIPEPVQAQCCRCEATGYLRSEHGT